MLRFHHFIGALFLGLRVWGSIALGVLGLWELEKRRRPVERGTEGLAFGVWAVAHGCRKLGILEVGGLNGIIPLN